jgi:hypothetical protein
LTILSLKNTKSVRVCVGASFWSNCPNPYLWLISVCT